MMKKHLLPILVCSAVTLGSVAGARADALPSRPVLSITRQAEQMIQIDCVASPARLYLLQTTTDLLNPDWANVTTAVPNAAGLFSWSGFLPKTEPTRFYRLAALGPVGGGLLARNQILFAGRPSLDSYDSASPSLASGPFYSASKRNDHALAMAGSHDPGAISVNNGHIYGRASTGPGGTILCGKGAVGDLLWNVDDFGVQPGHADHNASVSLQDNSLPSPWVASTPGAGTFEGQDYAYLLGTGNYELPSLNLAGGEAMAVSGNAILHVAGDFTSGGTSFVYIAPGATLRLYIGGKLAASGKGLINAGGRPSACSIFGLPTCTAITFDGTSAFYGVVDAPQATLTFSGTTDASGSFIADNIVLNGNVGVHYDESLAGE